MHRSDSFENHPPTLRERERHDGRHAARADGARDMVEQQLRLARAHEASLLMLAALGRRRYPLD